MAFSTGFQATQVVAKPHVRFSYTKIKNYESCPLRHFHYDVAKDIREPESDELRDGNEVHHCMHQRLKNNIALPAPIASYEKWVTKFLTYTGTVPMYLIEERFGIRSDFSPCEPTPRDPGGFFAKDVWYSAIFDAVKIQGDVALNWDWKTGKVKEDPLQIVLAAAVLMAWYPQIQAVRNQYIWLAYDVATPPHDIRRDQLPEVWADAVRRIQPIQQAHDIMTFLPKKNGLCRHWCAVETCIHHGT